MLLVKLVAAAVGCAAFTVPAKEAAGANRRRVVVEGGRKATPLGRQSTREGKANRVAKYKEEVFSTDILYCVEGAGVSVAQLSALRKALPADSKAIVLKNTLFKIAAVEAGWDTDLVQSATALLENPNLWILSGSEHKETMKVYKTWVKESGLDKDRHSVKGGFADGSLLDGQGVEAMVDLPTKPELMARLAGAIQTAGSLRLAKALKQAAGQKMAVALKISVADEEKNTN